VCPLPVLSVLWFFFGSGYSSTYHMDVLAQGIGATLTSNKLKVRDMAQNLRVGPEFPSMP
jgi:hypothetical protein